MRLPFVPENELMHVVVADRSYVASEMRAFLLYWLSELRCPVLNRPTMNSLCGPGWRPEHWTRAAAELGMAVRPRRRRAALSVQGHHELGEPELTTVTVIGDRSFGAADSSLAGHARRLARAAGVRVAAVHFSGPERGSQFVAADLWPDLAREEVADALLETLLESPRSMREGSLIRTD